jgi:RimJ/RimL family protein N-acetyltransferase
MEITLRRTTPDDIDFVSKSEHDESNKPFIGQWTKEQHINSLQNPDIYHVVVEHIESGRSLGYIILAGLTNPNKSIEFMRIVINDKGKGYGKMTVHLVKKLVFEELKAHRLWLDVKEFNLRAQKLYESEGFMYEGKLRDYVRTNNNYESIIIMSILETEYVKYLE